MPFFRGKSAMSEESKRLRAQAAKELRASRNGGSIAAKTANVKRAAALKALAMNEEWLQGEIATTKNRDVYDPEADLALVRKDS
jgi:hypothetical protein